MVLLTVLPYIENNFRTGGQQAFSVKGLIETIIGLVVHFIHTGTFQYEVWNTILRLYDP